MTVDREAGSTVVESERGGEEAHDIGTSRARLHIIAACVVAALIRGLWINTQSYHIDELLDRNIAEQSWSTLFSSPDGFPPGFYYVEKAWIEVFGQDSIRALALVIGMAAWIFLVLAARVWRGDRAMIVAAWVAAVAPVLVWLSQEMRPHSMLVATSAACLWSAGALIRRPDGRTLALFVGIVVIGAWTHYFFVPLAGTAVVVVLANLWRITELRRRLVVSSVVGLVLLVPLLLVVNDDLGLQQDDTQFGHSPGLGQAGYGVLSLVTGTTVGPSVSELRLIGTGRAVREMAPWLLLLTVPAVLCLVGLWRLRRVAAIQSLVVLFVVPLTAVLILTSTGGTGLRVRYLMVAAAPFVLLVSAVLATLPRRWLVVSAGVLAVVAGIASFNRNYVDVHSVPDLRGVAEYIESTDRAAAPIVINQDTQGIVLDEYIEPRTTIRVPPVADRGDLDEALELLSTRTGDDGFWFVYSLPWFGDPDGLLRQALIDEHDATIAKSLPWADVYWIDGS